MSGSEPSPFSVEVREDPAAGCAFVVPEGELDALTVPDTRRALDAALATGARHVVLDLREVTFIDSTGIRLMVEAEGASRKDGLRFAIVDGGPAVQRLLAITGLTEQFPRYEP